MYHGQKWLVRIDQVVFQNLSDNNLNNELIADAVQISERHLFRRVKQITGLSPQKYIRQYKLECAMRYLKNGRFKTVKETATAIGYSNTSYFITQFEKTYGQKPFQVLRESGWR